MQKIKLKDLLELFSIEENNILLINQNNKIVYYKSYVNCSDFQDDKRIIKYNNCNADKCYIVKNTLAIYINESENKNNG